MAIDRQGTGLAILRICLGVFFLFEGIGKIGWLGNTSMLAGQFATWASGLPDGSLSAWYLHRIAVPYTSIFARLVPLGELTCGLMLISGFWTPIAAFIAFFMAFNFQFASGALFRYSFLTSGYGLPILGGTLALVLGGARLPWSVRP